MDGLDESMSEGVVVSDIQLVETIHGSRVHRADPWTRT
jgi:hypothetical protein